MLNLSLKSKPKRFRFLRHKDLIAYWIERWMIKSLLKHVAMQKRLDQIKLEKDWLEQAKLKTKERR